ncbi:MAG: UPF0280 family protein [Paracoccaceae bacterium]
METPRAYVSENGTRLRLVHGPIDIVAGADGADGDARLRAFAAARERFRTILSELVAELPILRSRCSPGGLGLRGPVARRMEAAVLPFAGDTFVTPMAAVAGAVSAEIVETMLKPAPLTRAFANNGGDIAVHLSPGAVFEIGMARFASGALGRISISAGDGIGGIASSGATGRSLSMGIADSVTVLAADAPSADAAATLIANAVDLPGHPGIERQAADRLQPDTDLGNRLVVTGRAGLSDADIEEALERGAAQSEEMLRRGLIGAAALFLENRSRFVGGPAARAFRISARG